MPNTASRYIVAVINELEAAKMRKLLDGYGHPVTHDESDIYEVFLSDMQAERIEQRHGNKLRMQKE